MEGLKTCWIGMISNGSTCLGKLWYMASKKVVKNHNKKCGYIQSILKVKTTIDQQDIDSAQPKIAHGLPHDASTTCTTYPPIYTPDKIK